VEYAKILGGRISPSELLALSIEDRSDWNTILEGKFGNYWQQVPLIDLQYCCRDWLDYSAKHFYGPVCLMYAKMLSFIALNAKAEGLAHDAQPESFFTLHSTTITQAQWLEPYIFKILDWDSRASFWDDNLGTYATCLALTLTGKQLGDLRNITRHAMDKNGLSPDANPVNTIALIPDLWCILSSLTLCNDPRYPFRPGRSYGDDYKTTAELIITALKKAGLSKAEISSAKFDLSAIEMISREGKLALATKSIASTGESDRLVEYQTRALDILRPNKRRSKPIMKP